MSLGKVGGNVGNLGRQGSTGAPSADQELAELQKKQEAGQLGAEDVEKFINSGGLAQALQANPQSRTALRNMLQQVAAKASRDQAQLDSLGQRFGLGQGQGVGAADDGTAQSQSFGAPGTATGSAAGTAQQQAFNPLAGNTLGTPSRIGAIGSDLGGGIDSQLADLAQLGGGGGYFEDKVFAIMCKVVEQFQQQIEQRLEKLQSEAQAAQGQQGGGGQGGGDTGAESRNIEFEKIKYDMQKLSQMQQAMSNVLNSMDELAKSAIHHIKAG
jgi:hypothetical protein